MAGPRLLKLIGIVLLFFSSGKEEKILPDMSSKLSPLSNDAVVGVEDRISKWKKTGQGAIGCLLNTHFVCTQY